MLSLVLEDIPIEYRSRFRDLLEEVPRDLKDVEQELLAYIETVRHVAKVVRLLNLDEANALAATGITLLREADTTRDEVHRLVQSAIHYLIVEEDDDEITGVLGFDDDILVMNAVCRSLARPDLVIPLTERS